MELENRKKFKKTKANEAAASGNKSIMSFFGKKK